MCLTVAMWLIAFGRRLHCIKVKHFFSLCISCDSNLSKVLFTWTLWNLLKLDFPMATKSVACFCKQAADWNAYTRRTVSVKVHSVKMVRKTMMKSVTMVSTITIRDDSEDDLMMIIISHISFQLSNYSQPQFLLNVCL